MFRMKSAAVLTLALGLLAASLAYAQSSTTPSGTDAAKPATEPAKPAAKATTTSSTHHKSSSKSAPKVDINSASKEDLMKVPGIGDATADKIIAGRPFKSKSDLEHKGIMNKAEYQKASAHIIAHQEKAEAATTEKK